MHLLAIQLARMDMPNASRCEKTIGTASVTTIKIARYDNSCAVVVCDGAMQMKNYLSSRLMSVVVCKQASNLAVAKLVPCRILMQMIVVQTR